MNLDEPSAYEFLGHLFQVEANYLHAFFKSLQGKIGPHASESDYTEFAFEVRHIILLVHGYSRRGK
jgi:hypothetical protein